MRAERIQQAVANTSTPICQKNTPLEQTMLPAVTPAPFVNGTPFTTISAPRRPFRHQVRALSTARRSMNVTLSIIMLTSTARIATATVLPWSCRSAPWPMPTALLSCLAALLPEVLIGIGLEQFAALAAKAMAPKPVVEVSLQHIHAARVSVREQAAIVVERLRRAGTTTFAALCRDSPDTLTTVARFLSLLELFREGVVVFDQVTPLGVLTLRWTGDDNVDADTLVTDEFEGAPPAPTDTPEEGLA